MPLDFRIGIAELREKLINSNPEHELLRYGESKNGAFHLSDDPEIRREFFQRYKGPKMSVTECYVKYYLEMKDTLERGKKETPRQDINTEKRSLFDIILSWIKQP